ncbi:glycoside hydrolase family 32 protein [Acidisarcina polymorpha]|nr:glycoside hydrolase family 32 protein [Acidisarcina polymorpha]
MHDPLRPQFHLLPRANWMNDPCAPRFFRGEYHMFFQYNPGAAVWGDMHWGHAKSSDLIHWTHLPIALSPTRGSYDAFGCFTGSALPGMEIPTILYTGVTKVTPDQETIRGEGIREVQCMATSEDESLRLWKKLEKPLLDGPPAGLKVTGFRDPCPWRDGDTWYMAIGSGFSKQGGAVLLYRSSDGLDWSYLHPLAQGEWNGGTQTNPVDTGEMWECPDFFQLGTKYILLYSTERKVYWQVGEFDKRELKFHAETSGLLDHGSYYAMKTMVDGKGRRILWGWIQETRSAEQCLAAGWAGAMSLPRLLTLTDDNKLRMEIPPEFSSVCREISRPPSTLHADASAGLPLPNRSARIALALDTMAGPCSLAIRDAERTDNPPLLAIRYDPAAKPSISVAERNIPLFPDRKGISNLDIWIDGSVIEIFVDRRQVITLRCYEPGMNLHAAWLGSANALKALQVSAVSPISADRLTGFGGRL